MFLLAHQDDTDVEAGEIFTFNLTPDKNSTLDTVYSPVANVQDAIEAIVLNKIFPIGSTYIQIAETDGSFDENKSPENLFGGTWQLIYSQESIFLRTEGSLANADRKNGIQGDAGRNATGDLAFAHPPVFAATGVFRKQGDRNGLNNPGGQDGERSVNFDLSRAYSVANEFRVRNILIRIYLRIA